MRGVAWAAVLCAVAASGCRNLEGLANPFAGRFENAPATATGSAVVRSLGPTVPTDGQFLDSVLIERPVGDEAVDCELWQSDRSALSPEVAALYAENGLRVAVHRGAPSPVLQKLLAADPDLVNPHRLTFANRKEAVLPTAGPYATCEYELFADFAATRTPVRLQHAKCGIAVHPDVAPEGRVLLECEPQIQHGERRERLRPTADATQFVMEGEVPIAAHPTLRFAVVLGPNDTLLIGWSATSTKSLGAALFAVEAEGRPRQRVLVIRVGRLGDPIPDLPPIRGLHGRASIAAEAGRK